MILSEVLFYVSNIITEQQNRMHSPVRKSMGEPLGQRRKLHSLRMLNPRVFELNEERHGNKEVFKKLQRSLERDNKEQQPVAQPTPTFPDDQLDLEDDTLWTLFYQQAQKVASKVSCERVNCYQRQFLKLKRQYKAKQFQITVSTSVLENNTKQKYKQIHALFEEIKQERAVNVMNSTMSKGKKKKSNPLIISDNSSKIVALKEAIEGLRKEVGQVQKQIGEFAVRQKECRRQWVWFLRKMLKENYFLRRGVIPILEQMVEARYFPKIQDMPQCLDQVSKKCLLQQHKNLSHAKPSYTSHRVNSEPKSKITGLAQSQLIRDIYKGAKEFMAQYVRQSTWKQKLVLPPISLLSREKIKLDWRQNQMKRLSHVYTGQKYVRSRSILFGPKVESFL